MQVKSGIWMHIGQWFDWPDWLVVGTALDKNLKLPQFISAADDILIMANVLDHADPIDILERLAGRASPAMSPRAALSYSTAPTLGDALDFIVKASNANNPCLDTTLDRVEGDLQFGFAAQVPLGRLFDYFALVGLIIIYKVVHFLAPDGIAGVTLETSFRDNASSELFISDFQCQVRSGAEANRLIVPAKVASSPNPEHDPALWQLAWENLAEFERTRKTGSIIEIIRKTVSRTLLEDQRVPRLKQVSSELGISERTIIRLLGEESTSFHAVTEEERRLLAAHLINDPTLSLQSVSELLGYSDKSSFCRSFKKWFGDSPGATRKAFLKAKNPETGCPQ